MNGNLAMSGPLTGGASITGGVQLSSVELRIPETGFGANGSLDGLKHVGTPAPVRTTLARADLGTGGSSGGGGGGAAYGLGITISAPSAVFIRGRGLDAELGGTLTVGGTTQNVITTGGVTLIRGRLDILGNRLALTEGSATLRGSLDPTLNLRAETTAADTAIQIAVEGLASNPTVTFSSSPDLPEDEILARLVFGRGLDQISAFQALKLASAIATLSGKGGAGTISKLRDGFGLDDLDVTTGEDGGLEVSAGTYISDNVYTDVTVGADGRAEVNLNLTLTPSLTARGSVGSDGSTGIGVYFEKDY
jgi:translocation and assembly module TamB